MNDTPLPITADGPSLATDYTNDEPENLNAPDGFQHELRSEVAEQFSITDDSSANWLVRRVAQARAYARHVEAWAAAEIRRAESEERFFLMRFGPQLEAWLRQTILDRKLRRKSVALPAGMVGLRNSRARFDISDASTTLAWAKQNAPDAVRVAVSAEGTNATVLLELCQRHLSELPVEERVCKSKLNAYFEQTGELPGGTVYLPAAEQLSIR